MRLALVLLLLASTVAADPKPGFDTYRGARNLCREHVSGSSMHIEWSSWATSDDVAKVIGFYEKATGKTATKATTGEANLEGDKGFRLSIYAATANDKFPSCATKPTASETTVILISQAIQ